MKQGGPGPQRWHLGVALCSGLAGCLLAVAVPAFARTDDSLPDLAAQQTVEALSADRLPDRPLQLDQLIELCFTRNQDLQAAAARLGEADARLMEANAAFYPQFTARVGYQQTNDPSRAFGAIVAQRRFSPDQNINQPPVTGDFRPEIAATWSLYRGGQDLERRAASLLGKEIAELDAVGLRNRLAEAVTGTYYMVLTAREHVSIATAAEAAVTASLRKTEARYLQGAALKADRLSLDVRLGETKENELHARNAVELALTGLRTLLALPSEAPLALLGPASLPEPVMSGGLTAQQERARKRRAELMAAEKQLAMRHHELLAAEGNNRPRVNAFASYGQNSRDPDFSLSRDNFTVGVAAEVDLFTGYRHRAAIQAARERERQARAQLEQTRLTVDGDVKRAWLQLQEANARAKVAQQAARAAEEALRQIQARFSAGAELITRYLEAQSAHVNAQSHAVTARYEAHAARARLDQATGRWND